MAELWKDLAVKSAKVVFFPHYYAYFPQYKLETLYKKLVAIIFGQAGCLFYFLIKNIF